MREYPFGLVTGMIGALAIMLSFPSLVQAAPEEESAASVEDDHPAIIAHPSVPEAALSDLDVQNAFLGRKTQWSDGAMVILVTIDDKQVHEAFLRRFIEKTPTQFRIFWKRLAFTGKALTPLKLPDEQAVIKFVTETKGAVGYVSIGKARSAGCKILANHHGS